MPLQRIKANPIVTRDDIPVIPPHIADPTSVFNPGAIKVGDRYLLMLRVQTRGRETFLVMAESLDGIQFDVPARIVALRGLDDVPERVYHVYDPRITPLGERYVVMFAIDTDGGCRLGTAVTHDFRTFDVVAVSVSEDLRNGVVFPGQIGGRYVRLDRPNHRQLNGGPMTGDEICLSTSDDLVTWSSEGPVMQGRSHYWDELIGSGPPPIKTSEGWLHIYHGVAMHLTNIHIYQAGAVLLDLDDPTQVTARTRNNILEPREPYELVGQVPNVVFPSGIVVERYGADGFAAPDSEIKVYYGAADTCVAMARTTVTDLIADCHD